MNILIGEIIGTMFLILLGDGVVANVVLNKNKGQGSGWIVITTAWSLAVFVGAYISAPVSGAHLNPAVTIGLAVGGVTPWGDLPMYFIGQFVGAFLGAALVLVAYYDHFKATEDKGGKLAVFCTGPAIRNIPMNLVTEIIGTFVLVFAIFAIDGPQNMGTIAILPVTWVVWSIGLSLGGPTGYAINPARDLGPRIAHAVLPVPGKGDSDWGYSWVPVVGPIIGAIIAGLLYVALKPFGF